MEQAGRMQSCWPVEKMGRDLESRECISKGPEHGKGHGLAAFRKVASSPQLGFSGSFRIWFCSDLLGDKNLNLRVSGDPDMFTENDNTSKTPFLTHQLVRKCFLSTYYMTGPCWAVLRTSGDRDSPGPAFTELPVQ